MSKYLTFILVTACCFPISGCLKQSIGVKSVQVPQDPAVKAGDSTAKTDGKTGEATKNQTDGKVADNAEPHPALGDPALADKTAPDIFRVRVETTKGEFVVEVTRAWSPNGADRFYNLVDIGFFNEIAIFRAIRGFMFQFGIHGTPSVSERWNDANIKDDPANGISNKPGTITFAKSGAPNSRSTQFFINLGNNNMLDSQGFTPFGKVVEGMDVVSQVNTEYGENAGDVQAKFQAQGNDYITKRYPKVDFIKSIKLIEE